MKAVELKDIKYEQDLTLSEADFAINYLNGLGPAEDLIFHGEMDNCVVYFRKINMVLALSMIEDPEDEDTPTDFCSDFVKWLSLWDGPSHMGMVWERIDVRFGDSPSITMTYHQELPT